MENSETSGWLDFAFECKYIDEAKHRQTIIKNEEIGRLLNHMINNPDKY
jgi:four helix bundle protein